MLNKMLKFTTVPFVLVALLVTINHSGTEASNQDQMCKSPVVPERKHNTNGDKECGDYKKRSDCKGKKPKYTVKKIGGCRSQTSANYYYYCTINKKATTLSYGTGTCSWTPDDPEHNPETEGTCSVIVWSKKNKKFDTCTTSVYEKASGKLVN